MKYDIVKKLTSLVVQKIKTIEIITVLNYCGLLTKNKIYILLVIKKHGYKPNDNVLSIGT